MSVGDIWQIIDKQAYLSQVCLNVYYVEETTSATSGPAPADVVNSFRNSVVDNMLPVQSNLLEHIEYTAINLTDPTQFGVFAFAEPGAVGGDGLPPFCAWAFKFQRTTRVVRNGQKRIAGIPESQTLNGIPTTEALALLNALASGMVGPYVSEEPDGSYTPRIRHALGTDPETFSYHPVADVSFTRVSTQNSRKFGHGA